MKLVNLQKARTRFTYCHTIHFEYALATNV